MNLNGRCGFIIIHVKQSQSSRILPFNDAHFSNILECFKSQNIETQYYHQFVGIQIKENVRSKVYRDTTECTENPFYLNTELYSQIWYLGDDISWFQLLL